MGLFQFIYNLIWPVPPPPPPPPPNPANSYYGFQYVPGNGAPGTLDPAALNLIAPGTPGLYVGFMLPSLGAGTLRWTGPGPVVPVYGQGGSPFMPGAPCAAVTNLINLLLANPPVGENWNLPAQTRLDLTGYLRYATWCLNLINQTAAGLALLNALRNGAHQVIINPFSGSNNATALAAGFPTNAVAATLRSYGVAVGAAPLDRASIRAAVDLHYVGIGVGVARYNQLATDVYAMPLYSLFVDEANFAANILTTANYQYQGAPITGQNLMDWLSIATLPAFEAMLSNDVVVSGVNLRRFLCMAMTITLLDSSAARGGLDTVVGWNVLNEGQNQIGDPDWRPPAIGLAHELIHAYYNAAGSAPGYDNNDFSSTAAELQVSGIVPFNGNAISENQVRAQWGNVNNPAPDATNTTGGIAFPRRTVYTPPGPGQTVVQLRGAGTHI